MRLIFMIMFMFGIFIQASSQVPSTVVSNATVSKGTNVSILLFETWRNPSMTYHFALARNHIPGQIIQRKWIPLNRDDLFFWSLAATNTIDFSKSRGPLNNTGVEISVLRLPNSIALVGLKYRVAAVISISGTIIDVSTHWETLITP